MSRLGGVHGSKGQPANHAAQAGDSGLIDIVQWLERQALEVEVSASLGVVLAAFGVFGAERFEGAFF
jgi:hypothetical protein